MPSTIKTVVTPGGFNEPHTVQNTLVSVVDLSGNRLGSLIT